MKKILTLVLVLFFANVFVYAQEGSTTLGNFSGLKVMGAITVEITKGDVNSAEVTMISGDRNSLMMEVDNEGILRIKFYRHLKAPVDRNQAKVLLTYKNLNNIVATAAAKIVAKEAITSEQLYLVSSAGSTLQLVLKVNELEAKVNAGSTIILSGDAHHQIANSTSGSTYNASKLYSNIVIAKSTSGAKMIVWCTESITARTNSGGKLSYKGNPAEEIIKSGIDGFVKKL